MISNMEVWKDIPGYEGSYKASNLGRIKGLDRYVNSKNNSKRLVKGRLMLPQKSSLYLCVCLNSKSKLIHRQIAKAFIPNPQNKPCVNHKDGNGNNNNIDNLEWVTYSENELHSIYVLGKALKKVKAINIKNGDVYLFNSIKEGANFVNGRASHITQVCKGNRNTHAGYQWEYVN